MYVIKHFPEDFVVVEDSSAELSEGSFVVFRLWKRGVSTVEACRRISNILGSQVFCAGLKDKNAVTEQVCSVRSLKSRVVGLSFPDMKLSVMGARKEPVHVGDLRGNYFRIVVRNVDVVPEIKSRFRNLFGEQRFSSKNVEIGRLIVKRDFEKAVLLISEIMSVNNSQFVARRDWLGALRCVPRKVLVLFVHAFQSWLWNKAALLSDEEVLPIVGFGSHELGEITERILAEENVKSSDFVIRELPELSAEGGERSVWACADNLKVSVEDDDVFYGKKKVILEFFLSKGCYATEFIRQNFTVRYQ